VQACETRWSAGFKKARGLNGREIGECAAHRCECSMAGIESYEDVVTFWRFWELDL